MLSVNMVVNCVAVLVFVLLMVTFWWLVASQEMSNAVRRKGRMLTSFRQCLDRGGELRDGVMLLDARVRELDDRHRDMARAYGSLRRHRNTQLTLQLIAPVVALLLGLLVGTVAYNATLNARGASPPQIGRAHV